MTIDNSTAVQTQMQMRKMDGSGGGQHGKGGENGLKDVMQNLSVEDRSALQEQLSAMSSDEKQIAKEQLKSVDATDLSSEDYLNALLLAIGGEAESSTSSDGFVTEVYA